MFTDGADILAFKRQGTTNLYYFFSGILLYIADAYIINLFQNTDQKANNLSLVSVV